jgi:hypothetical protein
VAIFPRDFKPEHGLLMPHLLETAVESTARPEKIIIESVAVNVPIDDTRFGKPK